MKLDLAKELFRDSWGRRDQLTAGIATPIAVLSGLVGAVALLVADFEFDGTSTTVVFCALGVCAIITIVGAVYFIVRSYHGYDYQELPNALELQRYYVALADHHRDINSSPELVDEDFDAYLSERLVEAADANSTNNVSKAAYLHRSTQWLIVAVVATTFVSVPWAIRRISRDLAPPRATTEMALPPSMGEEQPMREVPASPFKQPSPQVPPKPAPRPEGPPNRLIREGEQPPARPARSPDKPNHDR